MSINQQSERLYQFDNSHRWILRKERLSRHINIGFQRDNFSCPDGMITMTNNETRQFGVSKQDYRVSHEFNAYNKVYWRLYGEEI